MSQPEVLKFLNRNSNYWWSAREIADRLGQGSSSISTNLKALRKTDMIIVKGVKPMMYSRK